VELLHASFVVQVFAPHSHDEFAVGVIESGIERIRCAGVDYEAPAGSIVVINPGVVHTGQAATEEGWAYRAAYPSLAVMRDIASELAGRPMASPFLRGPLLHDPVLASQLAALLERVECGHGALEREIALTAALMVLQQRYGDFAAHRVPLAAASREVTAACDYMHSHYGTDLTLQELAAVAGLSKFHFLRVFRRHTGMTPHVYLTQLRVRMARLRIAAGTPLAAVAAECGFVDQSHMCRHFRRVIGVTPGVYARLCGVRRPASRPEPRVFPDQTKESM
jgi:AraC-like DNA-binding protein